MWWHKGGGKDKKKKGKRNDSFRSYHERWHNPLWRTRAVRKIWLEQCGNEGRDKTARTNKRTNHWIFRWTDEPNGSICEYSKRSLVTIKIIPSGGIYIVVFQGSATSRHWFDVVLIAWWIRNDEFGRSKLFKQERFINRIVDWLKKGEKECFVQWLVSLSLYYSINRIHFCHGWIVIMPIKKMSI